MSSTRPETSEHSPIYYAFQLAGEEPVDTSHLLIAAARGLRDSRGGRIIRIAHDIAGPFSKQPSRYPEFTRLAAEVIKKLDNQPVTAPNLMSILVELRPSIAGVILDRAEL